MMDISHHERFHLKNLDQLRAETGRLGLRIPVSEDLSALAEPLRIGPLTIPNRFVALPMEGFDSTPDGSPGDLSFRRYRRYAAGGFGLIWVEATAVLPEVRSNTRQFFLHEGSAPAFARLAAAIRRAAREAGNAEPALVIQLTHSGRYSKPSGTPRPVIAHHSPVLDPAHNLPPDYPLISDDALDRLPDIYVSAARLAAEAGFDGVDVKSCHRYLLSELLASFTREGRYGGSFENRTRLLRDALARIRAEVPSVFVTTRINAFDAIRHPYGFGVDERDERVPDLREPLRLVGILRDIAVPVVNISAGNPYSNPHVGRPYDFPVQGMNIPGEHPLAGLARLFDITRQVQQAYPGLPVVGAGYTWLRHLMPAVASGVLRSGGASLIGIGRGAFAYPDAVRDILHSGRMDPARCCVTCSACTQIMRDGGMTGCVVRDSEIYGPQYRLGRRFALDRLRAEAERCRDCEEPTCSRGCPARVNVPAFVKAFADGDVRRAYETLRVANALPEMCACVCPAEVQCEGACLERIFRGDPIPIRDIQRVTCRLAREMGITGVRLPPETSGKKVAVVGAGPAGLACAIELLERGHRVAIFEKGASLGGVPEHVIPADRIERTQAEAQAILQPALDAGRLQLLFNRALGRDLDLAGLRRDHDAVCLAVGLGAVQRLGRAPGVVDALSFLSDAKSAAPAPVPPRVAVLGGGNTAIDAAVTARRLGAGDVFLLYRRSFDQMPAWPGEIQRLLQSGVHCMILTQPVGYDTGADGRLKGIRIARTELGAPDSSGRRTPAPAPGAESLLPVDQAIEATGQQVDDDARAGLAGVGLTGDGRVRVAGNGSLETSVPGVFAAGDLVSGGATAVQSVAEGMRAAEQIDRALRAESAAGGGGKETRP
jgi:NADPH-dependent glutamate synthase beta subunit-like oxidoreductase/2,4-dienoyl-CoA reductase-like NADH-dependent reductase (Old Yellow Enzyme family)